MSKKFAYIKVSQTSSRWPQRLLIHRHLTCVLTWYCFSWKLEKTHWWQPTKCAILHFLTIYLLCKWRPLFKYAVCEDIDFPRKQNKGMCINHFLFLSLSMGNSCNAKDTLHHCQKNKKMVHAVLLNLFEHIKYSV
jgi:hypothetical protein